MIIESSHAQLMDRIYRYQRFFYDITRRYYLLGRDRLIRDMDVRPGSRILEIGCGTARNLIRMARRYPHAHFYGLDASHEMLRTAESKILQAGLKNRITVHYGMAEEVNAKDTFGLAESFDGVFFSYSLSMIPLWKNAIKAGWNNLKSGGQMGIVDFCDQKSMPHWFRYALTQWLSWFHVRHEPELIHYVSDLALQNNSHFHINYLKGRYSFIAVITKTPAVHMNAISISDQ